MEGVTRTIHFFLHGEPILWEIPVELHRALRSVADKTKIPIQNIVSGACHKYGKRIPAIRKFIRDIARDYKKNN